MMSMVVGLYFVAASKAILVHDYSSTPPGIGPYLAKAERVQDLPALGGQSRRRRR